jgi:hypothetical protein
MFPQPQLGPPGAAAKATEELINNADAINSFFIFLSLG